MLCQIFYGMIHQTFFMLKGQLHEVHLNLNLVNCIFFSVQQFQLHVTGHIFVRISIFYQVVLEISRLENHTFLIHATEIAVLFSQKQHDGYFSGAEVIAIYFNTKIYTYVRWYFYNLCLQLNFFNALYATIPLDINLHIFHFFPFNLKYFRKK